MYSTEHVRVLTEAKREKAAQQQVPVSTAEQSPAINGGKTEAKRSAPMQAVVSIDPEEVDTPSPEPDVDAEEGIGGMASTAVETDSEDEEQLERRLACLRARRTMNRGRQMRFRRRASGLDAQ